MKLFRITVRYKNVQYMQSCGVHWGALGTDILHTVCIMLTSPVLLYMSRVAVYWTTGMLSWIVLFYMSRAAVYWTTGMLSCIVLYCSICPGWLFTGLLVCSPV